jgi:hypothetical protein
VAQKSGKKTGDEALLLALASGLSVPKAAATAGVSERTAYRRLRELAFRSRVAETRVEIVSATVGRLAALGSASADALEKLLKSKAEPVRLGAARTALEYMFKSNEQQTLARQLDDLRAEVEAMKKNGDGHDATGGKPPAGAAAGQRDGQPGAGTAQGGPGQPAAPGGHGPGSLAGSGAAHAGGADPAPLFPPGRQEPDHGRPGAA